MSATAKQGDGAPSARTETRSATIGVPAGAIGDRHEQALSDEAQTRTTSMVVPSDGPRVDEAVADLRTHRGSEASQGARAAWWLPWILGLGFLFFGFALGEIAGLSVTQGISQTLLTSVFTFVGGVMLSYAGFRKVARASDDGPTFDLARVSVALFSFSLGLGVGVPAGVYGRCNVRVESWLLGEGLEHSTCNGGGPVAAASPNTSVGVMNGVDDKCKSAIKDLNIAVGEPGHDANELHTFVSKMIGACSLNKP